MQLILNQHHIKQSPNYVLKEGKFPQAAHHKKGIAGSCQVSCHFKSNFLFLKYFLIISLASLNLGFSSPYFPVKIYMVSEIRER